MTVWTPPAVEAAIFETANLIEETVNTYRETHEASQRADREYDRAFARAYLDATGTQNDKKYQAELNADVISARDAKDVAEAAYRYATSRVRALEKKLDALRSIGSSVRQAYAAGGNW